MEQHNDDVAAILTKTPAWMLRWGLTVLFILITLLFTLANFLRYPDVVHSDITINSENPPVALLAQVNGNIDTILIRNNEVVEPGQVLAVVENPARYIDVVRLEGLLDTLDPLISYDSANVATFTILLPDLRLGSIQPEYSEFVRVIREFQIFAHLRVYPQKLIGLNAEKISLHRYYARSEQEISLLGQDVELGKTQYEIDSSLYKLGAISKTELMETKSAYLNKDYGYRSSQRSLAQTQMQISSLEYEALELELSYQEELAQHLSDIHSAHERLISQLKVWELQFLFKSPIRGTIATFNLTESQPIFAGDQVLIITPENTGNIMGRIRLPISNSAKVQQGQKVIINILNYPHEEFGQVSGIIRDVSIVPMDSIYMVNVEFPNGLITSTELNLEFRQEMLGTCEIITKNRSVLDRILGKLTSVFN